MGAVLRAVDTRLHREVAIKVLNANLTMPGLRERFLREARAASSLNHPNICTVFDIGEQDGEPYMVMELLHGETLKEHLEQGAMPTEMVVSIAREVTDALCAAHANGIVHRDIKPANIFLVPKPNGTFQVKVLDFGLAKFDRAGLGGHESRLSGLTTVGATVGTVAYMSPEQARGETLDARSDLFSFGAVMYEMVTGTVPFHGATSAVVFVELLSKDPAPIRDWNAKVPRELESVINRLLEKDRNNRYQNAVELYKALDKPGASGASAAAERSRPAVVPLPGEPVARERRTPPARPSGASRTNVPAARRSSSPSRPSVQISAMNDPMPAAETQRLRQSGMSAAHRSVAVEEAAYEQDYSESEGGGRGKLIGIVAGVVLLLALGGYFAWSRMGSGKGAAGVAPGGAIQITTIENHTGDGTLDGVAAIALELVMDQSPALNVRGESGFRTTLGKDERPNGIDAATARASAQATGASVYVYGNMQSAGPQQYALSVEARRTDDNGLIAKEDEQVAGGQSLPVALEHVAQRLRTDLGENDGSIRSNQVPLALAASTSLPALQALRDARTLRASGDYVKAAASYQKAADADAQFYLARMELALLQFEIGADVQAAENFAKAGPLANRGPLTQRMELRVIGKLLAGDPMAAADFAKQWTEAIPGESRAFGLQAMSLRMAGKYADAAQAAQRATELDPADQLGVAESERNMMALNRFESIIQTEERGQRIGLRRPGIALLAAYALGRVNGGPEQSSYTSLIAGHVRDQSRFADYLDNTGQLTLGANAWNSAAEAYAAEPATASASQTVRQAAALNRALVGQCEGARTFLARSADVSQMNAIAVSNRGLASAMCGDLATGRGMADLLRTRFAHQPVAETFLLPNLEAEIQIASGQAAQALTTLGTAHGPNLLTMTAFLRASAHIALRQHDTAIADLQTVLANRGMAMLGNSVLYPVAQRRLADTYSVMGDKVNAQHAYEAFAKTWAHADASVAPKKP